MAKAEIKFGELGGGGISCATAFQYVAPSAPSVTFSNLEGTPKRVTFVGHRGSDSQIFIHANYNPTTGEISTTNTWVTRRPAGSAPVAWTTSTADITINGNSVTKITGNSDSYYWLLIYEV